MEPIDMAYALAKLRYYSSDGSDNNNNNNNSTGNYTDRDKELVEYGTIVRVFNKLIRYSESRERMTLMEFRELIRKCEKGEIKPYWAVEGLLRP